MAYVIAAPEMMAAAAADLAAIGSNVSAAHLVAAARTTSVIPAAADEVSASIAHLFSQHAASYQALAGRAAAFQEQFVQHLTAGAFSYTSIEAAITSFLQNLQNLPNVIADDLAAPFPGEAALASLLQNSAELLSHPHLSEASPIGTWFVDAHPLGSVFTPREWLVLALIAPIYIPYLIAGEAVILPIATVGTLLLLPFVIGAL
jgi:hypothetical protein